MKFGILGPLVVSLNGGEVVIGAAKERALLTMLLLRRGEVVSTETLVEELWDERPPTTATKAVHVYVSHLRKALGDGAIETRPTGYVLRADALDVDGERFASLLERGRAQLADGDAETATVTLRDALTLWRGPALGEFRQEPFARDEAARLEELRLAALEQRIEADLALDRAAEVVPELEALVRQHPLRERMRRLLMLGLYRAGRQADALAVYRHGRRTLAEELGLEPSEPLRELERAILNHDTALSVSPPGAEGSMRVSSSRRRRFAAAAATLTAAAGVAIGIVLTHSSNPSPAPIAGDSAAVYRLGDGRLVALVALAAAPNAVAADGGSLWIANVDANSVTRVDARKAVAVQTIRVGHGPSGIAVGGGAVWVANGLDGTVSRVDEQTNDLVQTIRVGNRPIGVALSADNVWVANAGDGTLTQIDRTTGRVRATIAVGRSADGVAVGFGSVWVTSESAGTVSRVDPGAHAVVESLAIGSAAGAIAVGAGSVWVADDLDGTVSRIDPATNRIRATIPVGADPNDVAVSHAAIWVSNESSGTVVRIDPARNAVVQSLRTTSRPEGVAVAGRWVLAALRTSGATHRGGSLSILTPGDGYTSLDPSAPSIPSDVLTLTNDGLTGFRRVGGTAGTQLVPDLAVSLPSPTNGGRNYTFRLRPGIRYSNGAVVRPQDVRRAIERSVVLNSVQGAYYAGIVGARRCVADPRRPCDLSRGIVTDPEAGTITFHLEAPDPSFLYALALPAAFAVPAGTPLHIRGWLPATGPYRVTAFTKERRVRLERNPYFREWSAAAQPNGFPNRLTWTFQASPDVAAVLHGRADIADIARPSPAALARLRLEHGGQLQLSPWDVTWFLVLNTRRAPFDDVRVRRALNYAVDRRRLLDLTLGHGLGTVTCQILPPNLDGYRRFCPYTAHPGPAATWAAPDLRRARALVQASGTTGQRITVWIPRWTGFGAAAGRYVASVLDRLGYHARYRFSPDPYPQVNQRGFQVGFYGWLSDFATAAGFIPSGLSCAAYTPTPQNLNIAEFCDPAIDRKIAHAESLQTTDPATAARAWTAVDRDLTNAAPWVPFANGVVVSVTAKRVGDYQFNPQLGTLFDQLWVR